MGIFSDVGRYFKAREFKTYMESGGGTWLAFGVGSPNWDYFVRDANGNSVLNVPVATPRSCVSTKSWIAKDRGIDDVSQLILNPNARIFLDTSYTPEGAAVPEYDQIPPMLEEQDVPSQLYLSEFSSSAQIIKRNYDSIESSTPEDEARMIKNPTFPQCYVRDFKSGDDWLLDFNVDPDITPTDQSLYNTWAKSVLVKEAVTNKNPLGFLSIVKATTRFVIPTDEPVDNISIFMYGSQKWKMLNDQDAERINAHHILITCVVFPGDLHKKEVVEREMTVRQVQVYHFNQIEGVTHSGNTKLDTHSIRNADCYFKSLNTTFPPGSRVILENQIELLINDFMTQRTRKVNQSDRYGFIIGF